VFALGGERFQITRPDGEREVDWFEHAAQARARADLVVSASTYGGFAAQKPGAPTVVGRYPVSYAISES
jgi:hypothetical protein